MALPKRKTSISRRNKRRANWKLSIPALTLCPNCNKPALPYRVCRFCGYYAGEQVVKIKEKKKKAE